LRLALCASALSGCITAKDFAAMIAAASKDNASVCGALVGGGGGMTIAPGAAVPVIPGAGYYGKAVFCRTNQPGTSITQGIDGTLTIKHGVYKRDVDAEKLKELEEKIANYEQTLSRILRGSLLIIPSEDLTTKGTKDTKEHL
jgi:hypothetical protein